MDNRNFKSAASCLDKLLMKYFKIRYSNWFTAQPHDFRKNKYQKEIPEAFQCLFRAVVDMYTVQNYTDVAALGELFQMVSSLCHRQHIRNLFTLQDLAQFPLKPLPESRLIFSNSYRDCHKTVNADMDIVRESCTSGNIGLLRMLLDFGATMLKPQDNYEEWKRVNVTMCMLFNDYFERLGKNYFDGSLLWKFDATSRTRLYIVMMGIETLARMRLQPRHSDKYKACLRLVFKSIPEPEIRSREVKEVLEKLLRGAFEKELEKKMIRKAVKVYEKLFPESVDPVGPRSLFDLSRIQVRQNLRGSGCFINKMYSLDSVKPIKKLISVTGDYDGKDCPFMLSRQWHGRILEYFPMITDEKFWIWGTCDY